MKPASISSGQEKFLARWYETFLDACKMAKRRKLGIVIHPAHKSPIMDMMERVAEDPLWNMGDLPPLVVHPDCPRGEYRFVDPETLQMLSAAAANHSRKGVGRFDRLWTPDKALKEG